MVAYGCGSQALFAIVSDAAHQHRVWSRERFGTIWSWLETQFSTRNHSKRLRHTQLVQVGPLLFSFHPVIDKWWLYPDTYLYIHLSDERIWIITLFFLQIEMNWMRKKSRSSLEAERRRKRKKVREAGNLRVSCMSSLFLFFPPVLGISCQCFPSQMHTDITHCLLYISCLLCLSMSGEFGYEMSHVFPSLRSSL